MNVRHVWNSLSVPWKWRLLIIAVVILFMAGYQLNIRKTVMLVREYNILSAMQDTLSIVQRGPIVSNRQAELKIHDSREELLNSIAVYCDQQNVMLREIMQSSLTDTAGLIIETNKLVLTGNYNSILNLLYTLEHGDKIANINSVQLELQKEPQSNEHTLYTTMQIKHVRHEK